MAEYAKIVAGKVDTVIVCDSDPVSSLGLSGTWKLVTQKVGIGQKLTGKLYTPVLATSYAVVDPNPIALNAASVSDEASPTWTYQWKKDTVNISGETSAALTIDPSTASTDDGTYTCEVSDGTSTVTTDGVSVTVTS